jgi:hypothetical protein
MGMNLKILANRSLIQVKINLKVFALIHVDPITINKQVRHSSEPESLRSTSTATNYNNNVPTSTNNKKYSKPPMFGLNKPPTIKAISNNSISSDVNKDSFVSNNKNYLPLSGYTENGVNQNTQNNYVNTITNTNNNKNCRKSSTNSNQSYLLNFKEKQKLTTSNSNNIEKKGKFIILIRLRYKII